MKQKMPDPPKFCKACGKEMQRKRFGTRLEDQSAFTKRVYCDRACMAVGMTSDEGGRELWARRARARMGKSCETCGATDKLQVHHENGDYRDNSIGNVKTLCASCHMKWHWANGKQSPTKRTNSECVVCGQRATKRMLCEKHYQRQRKHGSPHLAKRRQGPADRRGRRGWVLVHVCD